MERDDASPNLLWCLAIGTLTGFASALLGIGGGVIIVPLLTLLLRMPLKLAAGASVAIIIPAAIIAIGAEALQSPENFRLAHSFVLFAGAFVGVRLGSLIQNKVNERKLAVAFAVVLVITALRLAGLLGEVSGGAHDAMIQALGIAPGATGDFILTWGLTLLLGVFGGMAAPLFGLGGGVLFIPGLILLFGAFAEDYRLARAASLVTVLLTSAYAARVQGRQKMIPWPVVKGLLPGIVVGSVIGLLLIEAIDRDLLRTIMAFVLGLAAIRMVISSRRPNPSFHSG